MCHESRYRWSATRRLGRGRKLAKILDIGTGTGLIAIMLAQRYPLSQITAIEIDEAAAAQAKMNVARSSVDKRIQVICNDFSLFQTESKYNLIVSNPPYFVDALNCPDKQRNIARHTCELNYELLFRRSAHLLEKQGRYVLSFLPKQKS